MKRPGPPVLRALVTVSLAFLIALFRWRWRKLGRALLIGPRLLLFFCRFRRLRIEVREEGEEFLLAVI